MSKKACEQDKRLGEDTFRLALLDDAKRRPAHTRAPGERAVRPKPAASLILARQMKGDWHLLMGRRLPSLTFMPNALVFPGGRVDYGDYRAGQRPRLSPEDQARLTPRSGPKHLATGLLAASLRETWEETGYEVPAECTPHYLARAITPPNWPRRFDTRFFLATLEEEPPRTAQPEGELTDIGWWSKDAIASADTAMVTELILEATFDRLEGRCAFQAPGPFLFFRNGRPVIAKI